MDLITTQAIASGISIFHLVESSSDWCMGLGFAAVGAKAGKSRGPNEKGGMV